MGIAITDEHRALAEIASDLLRKRDVRGAARLVLETRDETMPELWSDAVELGWLGIHVPETYGGSGYGLEELVVLVEELGRAVTPGPFVPTLIAGAVLVAAAEDDVKAALLPGLVDGSTAAATGSGADLELRHDRVTGSTIALGGGLARILVAEAGEDVVVVDLRDASVRRDVPPNLDPTRRSARVRLDRTPAIVIPAQRQVLHDLARLVYSAEAVGVARECTVMASEYAKVRHQFGRAIGTFEAVKHHCANMLVATELASAAVWDAARAGSADGEQLTFAAAIAATLAGPAADLCANLNIQVHGGLGFTWEHDAHLYLRRATILRSVLHPERAAEQAADAARAGVCRTRDIELPAEAESIRANVRAFAASIKDQDAVTQRDALIETGFVTPHWPKPWGREAGATEQLVIEQEFDRAGIAPPRYGITGWIILTLIQHGTDAQVARWVPAALRQDVIWCQLFSEPDAGSDAAGIKTRATKVDGGWIVNGQKVWTSGAHVAAMGFATVRTNPSAPKHQGITTMVIDLKAPGVDVRPLRMVTGESDFSEVFLDDVFVPDDDVVGAVNSGWTVARATLGNESVSIGSGAGGMAMPGDVMLDVFDADPDRLVGGSARIGRYIATQQAMELLNLRSAHRAVSGDGPGPEGSVTKLVLSELGHEAADVLSTLYGAETAFMDGNVAASNLLVLMHRGMSIAGGTSEIKRNQIAERLLGLPRDPLLS